MMADGVTSTSSSMPRLSTSLLRHARNLDPLLSLLLRSCRDLPSACNELRWLRDFTLETTNKTTTTTTTTTTSAAQTHTRKRGFRRQWQQSHLGRLCVQRSRGKPLQYILGSQPFGDVDIICRPGVLIPRRETELYTAYIANSITTQLKQQARPQIGVSHASRTVRILDLCTGTGCIPLLLYSILSKHIPRLHILGVDISPTAVALAKTNLQHNVILSHLPPTASEQIRFVQEDVFSEMQMAPGKWDLVISNPPYISPRCFDRDTSRSVRNYEPKAALVPLETHAASAEDAYSSRGDTAIGDAFYPKILEIASRTEAKAMVVEVADLDQAERVAGLVVRSGRWSGCEIWRDWLDTTAEAETFIDGMAVKVKGEGSGRSVFACRSSRDHILHNTSNS